MGLILIIAMPLFGSVVCCCRCCCRRCGAEVSLEEAEAQNRLCSYIIAGIFGFGVILLLYVIKYYMYIFMHLYFVIMHAHGHACVLFINIWENNLFK